MTGLIYMYTAPNGKRYVGQTIRLEKRKSQHETQSLNPNCASYECAFHRAIRKYGIDNFKFEILEINIPRECLDEREIYWINKMKSFGSGGYNMTMGGNGNQGRIWSEDQRKHMSQIKKGQGIGKTISEEQKQKISKANKGKSHPRTEETKKKISEHNARAHRVPVMFLNSGVYHGKEYFEGMTFDCVKACADYFGVKTNTMSNIKKGLYNKKSNIKIVEIAQ